MPLQNFMHVEVKPCKFARVYATYDKSDQETLKEWINAQVPATRVVNAIANDNDANRMTTRTFLFHLRGQCNCPQGADLKGVL